MKNIEMDGITFRQTIGSADTRGKSEDSTFVLVKSDDVIEFYKRLVQFKPKNIMEVGMYEGGSLVWFDKLFSPRKLVGLDVRKTPITALEEYRKDKPHIKTYYGRWQDKPGTLMAARETCPEGLDLIVDDASHKYEQTRATFGMLFPLVKPGGRYIIEDWSWAHSKNAQAKDAVWADQPAMSNVILQLVVLTAGSQVIESVHIQQGLVCVTKGRGVFKKEMLDLTGYLRGREMPLI